MKPALREVYIRFQEQQNTQINEEYKIPDPSRHIYFLLESGTARLEHENDANDHQKSIK
jgi:hypothetical protein